MLNNHSCVKLTVRETDWVAGDGNIKFGALTSGDWTSRDQFFERQKIGYETEGCVLFTAQESFDAQMDALMPTLPVSLVTLFNQLGFMDVGMDGAVHFHSSPRFLQVLTGNGLNGNALVDPWDVMRKYGALPWKDLPYDETTTMEEYFKPIPQASLDKAKQFLTAIGGKNSIQYHWVLQNQPRNDSVLDQARQQAPLCLAVVAIAPEWNQVKPPINVESPGHSVQNYKSDVQGEWILDHYDPFDKVLQPGYPITYALQGIVSPVALPPAPTLPSNPTQAQEVTWLQQLKSWLLNLYERMFDGERLQGASRSPKWPEFKKEYAKTHLPVCAVCGGTKKLNLHHLQPFHAFPELELDVENVTWLCNKNLCHIRIGHLSDFKSINPNGKDDIVAWRDKIRNRPMTVEDIKRSFNKQ